MAATQVSDLELEEGVKVEDEIDDEGMARESEDEKADRMKPGVEVKQDPFEGVEDKQDPFEAEDEVHGGDEEGDAGITKLSIYAGARVFKDDDDEPEAEGEGESDEDPFDIQ